MFLWLIKVHTTKSYGGVEVQPHAFLTVILDGSERSASSPPPPKSSNTHCIGVWVGYRADLEGVENRQIFSSAGIESLFPSLPVWNLVTIQTQLFRRP
jgi:hypothetical protein